MNNLLFLLLALVPLLLVLTLSNNMTRTNAATPIANMTTYKDPQNRFTMLYPTDWTATPQADRFQSTLVSFANGAGSTMRILAFSGGETDPKGFARLSAINLPFGFSLFQDVECTKYKIDRQEACSDILTNQADPNLGTPGSVVMTILSYVNGKMYGFIFGAPESSFDSILHTFDTMIHSVKFLDTNSTGVSK